MRLITIKDLPQFKSNSIFKEESNYITISVDDTIVMDFILKNLMEYGTPFIWEYGDKSKLAHEYDESLNYVINTVQYPYSKWIDIQNTRYQQTQLLHLIGN